MKYWNPPFPTTVRCKKKNINKKKRWGASAYLAGSPDQWDKPMESSNQLLHTFVCARACGPTLYLAWLLHPSVGRLVTLFRRSRFFPHCSWPQLIYCPCPLTLDWGGLVSGLVSIPPEIELDIFLHRQTGEILEMRTFLISDCSLQVLYSQSCIDNTRSWKSTGVLPKWWVDHKERSYRQVIAPSR